MSIAGLAGLTALLTLTALSPEPVQTRPVVVVARSLPGGHSVTESDLAVAQWPAEFSSAAFTSQDEVVGKLTMGPIEQGEPVTASRLVDANLLQSAGKLPADAVAAPVRLADAEQTSLVRPGDRVDVIAARATDRDAQSAEVIAADAIVLTVPARERGSLGGSGLLETGGAGSLDSKDLIVVAVPSAVATELAAASTRSQLSIVLKPHSP